MKEDILNSEMPADGKFRMNSPRMKSKGSSFAEAAVKSLDSNNVSKTYETASKAVVDSANEIFSMASDNAKKTYDFLNKYKYQTLGILGVAGLAGAGYIWMRQRGAKTSVPATQKSKNKKTAAKTMKRAKKH